MVIIFQTFIFTLGLIIGSFLNAVIYRLENAQKNADITQKNVEKKLSIITGRSICPKCEHILAWYDLIPLFSFIFLLGKCRYCRQKISIQYPLVELAVAFLFVAIFKFSILDFEFVLNFEFRISDFLNIFYWFYIVSILIVIFVYDLKHYIIPDKIILPAIVVSLIWILSIGNYLEIISPRLTSLPAGQAGNGLGNWKLEIIDINNLLAALGAAGFFFSLILISKGKWMGFGDVKLAFLMGLVLDFPAIILALFTAFMSGAIIGVGLILCKKKGLKSQIPFGPFLVGGTIFSLFFGEIIIRWYLNILL